MEEIKQTIQSNIEEVSQKVLNLKETMSSMESKQLHSNEQTKKELV
jgi:hypothetical protein